MFWLLPFASWLAADPETVARVRNVYGVIEGPDRAYYACSLDDHAIFRVEPKTGAVQAVIENQNEPYEVRFDRAGNLFFVDMKAHQVKRRDRKTGVVTVVAGTGDAGFGGDGGPAVEAKLNQPHAIQFDPQGRLLICDIRNHRIRRVDPASGRIETWLGGEDSPVRGPRAIDFAPDGTLWLALREGNAVWKLDYATKRHTVVAEKLHGPKGIVYSRRHRGVFIADTESHEVSFVDEATGKVRVVAGGLKRPHGVGLTRRGALLIGDSENDRVLRVNRP